jgi:hypothetical protein
MLKRLSVALLLTAVALSAAAQSEKKGANGGDVIVMEGHPIEFVSKGQEIIFYILDEDGKSPAATAGLTGRAVIQDAGKTTVVNLSRRAKQVRRTAQMPLGSKARVVFTAKVLGHNLRHDSQRTEECHYDHRSCLLGARPLQSVRACCNACWQSHSP